MLVWGLMLLRSKLFYCLQLPIQSNARGGDQNGSVGINAASQQILLLSPLPIQSNARGVTSKLVWGLMLLRSKHFYCLRLPIQSNARGGDQNASLGINAAS